MKKKQLPIVRDMARIIKDAEVFRASTQPWPDLIAPMVFDAGLEQLRAAQLMIEHTVARR